MFIYYIQEKIQITYKIHISNIKANIYGGNMVMGRGIVMGGYDQRYIFHGGGMVGGGKWLWGEMTCIL